MLRSLLKLIVILCLGCTLILLAVSAIVIPDLPDVEALRDVKMQVPLKVYTHDGSLIAEFGEMRRTPVDINQVPQQFIHAFIAAEDDRFYQHPGVDWQGILRAVINLIKTGEKSQGGSTITMQVARNFFLTNEKSYMRKVNEIFLALKIEASLPKDEILELYLNKIYLGQRAYGIGAAAQVYYGSQVDKLTLPQMALIAGLPKAPSTTNPVTSPERAKSRRSYVLGRMLSLGYITGNEFSIANSAPITASLHSASIQVEAPYIAEMARRQLVKQFGDAATTAGYRVYTSIRDRNQTSANHALRSAVIEYDIRHGYRGPESRIEITDEISEIERQHLGTFPVIANLYPALVTEVSDESFTAYLSGIGAVQIEAEGFKWARKYINENMRGPEPGSAREILNRGDIIRIMEDEQGKWRLSQLPAAEGALVSFDARTGETLALTGGFDFYRSSFNRVIQAKRQPGSAFKPFIYSAALESGFTAASIINDAPLVKDYAGVEDAWRPENYSGRYYGPTRLREALIHSRNIVSIRLLDAIGINNALDHLARFGFDTQKLPHSLSLALGSGDLTPWDLAGAYCILANGGYRIEPYFIERIEENNGNIIFKADPLTVCEQCDTESSTAVDGPSQEIPGPEPGIEAGNEENPAQNRYAERVVDPQNIWIINSMTRDVIRRGTGTRALVLNRKDISGKTGTTNDQRDAWFAGYTPTVVTISWVGFDDYRSLGNNEVGGRAALPMWIDYMRTALSGLPESRLEQPPGLITARIDPRTGNLAGADTPDAIFEVFRPPYLPGSKHGEPIPDIFANEDNDERAHDQIF